ncbi:MULTISPECIES: ATP-binding cassette domain-containing protein [Legionella]|uniref:ATP-binding cassette domain-containing protein n=1 Tax=Legionella TaxID=445 RepID=UPI000F8D1026|nr:MULTISPECIES: ATP-binding cassette domain-containing protein [Legionella]MCP0914200.1 ATP-binding cassette domain-containing protein [Legionella sp. 27cVA30]RUR00541.1 ATP-binding cassette domain-containing protein [Legionella septentrionalis]RUR11742.1 ATP-binding cassette domain-containing protein [Legionella septentrionalis]RUR17430.1 ATP-binding cassette domain-containing protein [Legionella septentrionalis]
MIELSALSKSYAGHKVLHDIDLFIQENEIFGIIGKSGAGKSTLLRCLNLLERPDCGQVIIDGENLIELNSDGLRRARHKMAMIFQQFNLLNSKTVYDNIALPMRIQGLSEDKIKIKIDELLPLVELTNKVQAYPSQLSGGQKQRVAIARALSCSPKILLCDEATSALDPETTDAILALLKKINRLYGITIVLITHEMDVVKRICHRLAVMEAGKIIETTAIADVFKQKNSIARTMLYKELSPELPICLSSHLTEVANHKPLVRLFFEGEGATVPFISQTSRELHLDINILLANIDRYDTVTCGVLIAELSADATLLQTFSKRCEQFGLTVEVLGYVADHAL